MSSGKHDDPPTEHERRSLRGTVVAVALMGVFFVASWLGVLALALSRR
jgi:hypothetical protein